jgi:hypothetical protein
MHCSATGPITHIVFLLLFVCVVLWLILAALIDNRLFNQHPKECQEVRLNLFAGYQFYAWRHRGRALEDKRLTILLDGYRLLQVVTLALLVLILPTSYFGL